MKTKTRPTSTRRIPTCRKCGKKNWRRKGIMPRNTNASGKGWRNPSHPKFFPEAMNRLFDKIYVCKTKKCHTVIRYGNAGRPIDRG